MEGDAASGDSGLSKHLHGSRGVHPQGLLNHIVKVLQLLCCFI